MSAQLDPEEVKRLAREAARKEADREHEVADALLRELGEK